jgi:hypothetical protein
MLLDAKPLSFRGFDAKVQHHSLPRQRENRRGEVSGENI